AEKEKRRRRALGEEEREKEKERRRRDRLPLQKTKKKDSHSGAVLGCEKSKANETQRRGYFLAAAVFAAASAYFLVKRSTRPAVSSSFCLPVKKGWQLEQISTRSISPLIVE